MRNLFYVLNILIGMFLFSGCDHFLDEAPRGNAIAETVEDYDKMFNASTIMNMSIADSYYAYWKNDELIFTEDCYSTVVQLTNYPTSIKLPSSISIIFIGRMKILWNGKSVTIRSYF